MYLFELCLFSNPFQIDKVLTTCHFFLMLRSYLHSIQQDQLLDSLSQNQQYNLLQDILSFEKAYRGGIQTYVNNVRRLVKEPESSMEAVSVEVADNTIPSRLGSEWRGYCRR